MWSIRKELEGEKKAQDRFEMRVYDATPSSGMTWVDDSFMVVTHYLAGFANVTSPALFVKPAQINPGERDLYRTYEENANKLLARSTLIKLENCERYLPPEAKEE